MKNKQGIIPENTSGEYSDEFCIQVKADEFRKTCLFLHKVLRAPVAALFAVDERPVRERFSLYCFFQGIKEKKWIQVKISIPAQDPRFESLAKDIYSASLFEREIKEMFGIIPEGNPDQRRLNLHDEVWPEGHYPLNKDFKNAVSPEELKNIYQFIRVEGSGIFEVPVGPVHAGIIGPGHFRFSVAGEPIINLEARLGFTHRGVEKLFEGKLADETVGLAERVSGDSSFAHSLAFVRALEKISGIQVSQQALFLRGIFAELERMYNHLSGIAGIALDVSFSFPATFAGILKESVLQINSELCASRYLKGINCLGGVKVDLSDSQVIALNDFLENILLDFGDLEQILESSVSFMDRVDSTGILKKKTAHDFGVVGLAARSSGIALDLRKDFPGVYSLAKFKISVQEAGDVLSRLNLRLLEFKESVRLIGYFLDNLPARQDNRVPRFAYKEAGALGYAEGWRGPVLYWVKTSGNGIIERCKIVDPSFHNWQGLTYAVLGDIIPDFPVSNKSFDLSYSGNDL